MDYETLSNCFVAVFQHYKSNEKKIFVVNNLEDNFDALLLFLKSNIKNKEWHISYNGLNFDAQITHYILNNNYKWLTYTGSDIAKSIYAYAQSCINKSRSNEFQEYPEWRMQIQQLDVFKLNHWDNKAKSSSLKWIQFSMDWDNLLDMPIEHTEHIENYEQINTIIDYCINDVESTAAIYNRSTSQIKLRKALSKQYNINLFSASEPRISKEIFMFYMRSKMKITKYDFKKLRTHRTSINCGDIILPYISFKTEKFNNLLHKLQNTKLDPEYLKGQFNFTVDYKNVKTHFGLGGVHGACKDVYKSDDEYIIMSSDVTSFYPNLVIRNQWSPQHFPKELFCPQYEWFFDERVKIPKSNPMNYVLKIILNSTFGLSNDATSFFYDPELCMRITINGQLTLMMLYERIMEEIPGAISIMHNTDGIEIKIPRVYEEQYLEICSDWEKTSKLFLEHAKYSKLIVGDVNNYIAIEEPKKVEITKWREIRNNNPHYIFKVIGSDFLYCSVKLKGRFNFHNLDLHKNKSKLVVAKGVYEYFINNILPADYIKTNTNILDYCIAQKSRGDWQQIKRVSLDGIIKEIPIQKTNRYYISNKGCKIVKVHRYDEREIQLESGKWKQTILNKLCIKNKFEDYNVNIKYYIKAIENEIDNIINISKKQLRIF
jgi:hypothetical protein